MTYHELQITNRATLHSWNVFQYCESEAEAVRLARLTFPESRFDVVPVRPGQPNAAAQSNPAPASPKQVELF